MLCLSNFLEEMLYLKYTGNKVSMFALIEMAIFNMKTLHRCEDKQISKYFPQSQLLIWVSFLSVFPALTNTISLHEDLDLGLPQ